MHWPISHVIEFNCGWKDLTLYAKMCARQKYNEKSNRSTTLSLSMAGMQTPLVIPLHWQPFFKLYISTPHNVFGSYLFLSLDQIQHHSQTLIYSPSHVLKTPI